MCGNETQQKRILLVEDNALVARALVTLLTDIDPDVNVTTCDRAESFQETFIQSKSWFRIFVDVDLPQTHHLSLVRWLADREACRNCIILARSINVNVLVAAQKIGILGYISKSKSNETFEAALRSVLNGDNVFPDSTDNSERHITVRMTRRQHDILCLLQRGYSSKQIAVHLNVTRGTVDNHVSSVLRTLNVSSRTHAVAKALELGYIGFNISTYR